MVDLVELREAIVLIDSAAGGVVGIYDANQKVLAAARALTHANEVDWCIEHGSKAATPLLHALGHSLGMCQLYSLLPSKDQERCEFIKVVIIPTESQI